MSHAPLLQVDGLRKDYPVGRASWFGRRDTLRAVDDVSFTLDEHETLGLVGESGSGKSTTGRLILRLLAHSAGSVRFRGENILDVPLRRFQPYRRQMQMIFQDSTSSLNPAYNIAQLVEEPMLVHRMHGGAAARRERVEALLQQVGLNPAHAGRFPHEFSGGQRQRIGIARALALEPRLIIADEPVSALDVSVQAQVLNLLQALKESNGLSYLFIAHDLAVVRHMSQRIAVMYLGQIVEMAASDELYTQPLHPYTQMLLAAVPRVKSGNGPRRAAPAAALASAGAAPSPINRAQGCAFAARCPYRMPVCAQAAPAPREAGPGHMVRCHLA